MSDILRGEQFIRLTTFRKTGEPVGTPVWFAQNGDRLYVMTNVTTGKVKRLRHTPIVEIEACDRAGKPHGERLTGQARLLDGDDAAVANTELNRKYKLVKRMFDLQTRKESRVFIEITLG